VVNLYGDFDGIADADGLGLRRLALMRNGQRREVRLLYFSPKAKNPSDLHPYPIDPHTLIEQIMIDPRLKKERADRLKVAIREQTGFSGPIKRSLLYAPPKGFVFPLGPG
jgi:hypothetical protein